MRMQEVRVGWERHQEQAELGPGESSASSQSSLSSWARQGLQAWEGWEERDPAGKQAEGRKATQSFSLNVGLFAKEQGRNKDGSEQSTEGGKAGRWESSAEQSRRSLGCRAPAPQELSGLSTQAQIPGSTHTPVWPPSEKCTQKLLLQLPVPPHHIGSRMGIQTQSSENPLGHTWVTPNTTLQVQLLKPYLKELRILHIQVHKSGEFLSFWAASAPCLITEMIRHWMHSPNSQCTNLVLPFPHSWVLDFVQP